MGPMFSGKSKKEDHGTGDFADWTKFIEKYSVFVAHFINHFSITSFDEKKELDTLRLRILK